MCRVFYIVILTLIILTLVILSELLSFWVSYCHSKWAIVILSATKNISKYYILHFVQDDRGVLLLSFWVNYCHSECNEEYK
jgi:hypothetical protein